jgi:aminoglycoside phosphotransferase family enzyme/predicted kinase
MMSETADFPGLADVTNIDFATMLSMLTRPEAFPFALPADKPVTVIQTHASAVVLVPELVYKLKKPKNFGFFDFSTPSLRRHFCGEEVRVNRRFAPHVYLGVAPVLARVNKSRRVDKSRLYFGSTFEPDAVPMPGTTLEEGYVVDYAVVMVRLPDEAMLESRVRAGTASIPLLKEIAQHVAAFHATSLTDEHIANFGSLEVIRGNWEENFTQVRPYIGRTLDAATYDQIASYIHGFMEQRSSLFASRITEGRIRDCHGDLRLQHVYILDEETADAARQLPRLAILDGIEFNERFRYSDVTSEVAFLTMELEAASHCDLAHAFVEGYVAESGDPALRELLPFYSCYRACVRGKVLSFLIDEPEVPAVQREAARQQATSLFKLAASYTSGPTRPTLMLIGGLMGTGKSTLAAALRHEMGWALFSSDTTRKRLAHVDPSEPHANAFGQGLYSQKWTARTYDALLAAARVALAHGRSVLLDASFISRADRQAAARVATAYDANLLFVECTCPIELALKRLAQRWKVRIGACKGAIEEVSRASDARPDLYEAQSAAWEAYIPDEEPGMRWIAVTTALPLAISCEQVYEVLHMPRFTCWL